MEGVGPNGESGHLLVGYLASGGVGIGVELALHRESGFSRGRRNQFQDHRVAGKRLAPRSFAEIGDDRSRYADACEVRKPWLEPLPSRMRAGTIPKPRRRLACIKPLRNALYQFA